MTSEHTLHLTERRTSECRLAPVEVDFLLHHHAAAIEVLPTGRRGRYRVTPAGVAGVIVTPRRRIVIASKVPVRNLLLLLDPLAEPPSDSDHVEPGSASELIDLLAGQLALHMSERGAAGLHRAYQESQARGAFLVGQIDVPAQLRQPAGRKDQIHSRQDEHTIEIPCNQVPRTVAAQLLASGLLAPAVRERLAAAAGLFREVSTVALDAGVLARLPRDPPPGYGPLLALCRWLADALAPSPMSGEVPAQAFLLSLERLFEQYVTRAVLDGLARPGTSWQVTVQESRPACEAVEAQPAIDVRPDVRIDRGGRPVLVLDAKWKRLPPDAVVTEDLYQVLAYCTVLGVRSAVLVYPGPRHRVWDFAFPHADVHVQMRTLNVAGSAERCASARRRLGRDLRRLLRHGSSAENG
jgi:5-methylcytosine-specific restriction enzyme subunit McrC